MAASAAATSSSWEAPSCARMATPCGTMVEGGDHRSGRGRPAFEAGWKGGQCGCRDHRAWYDGEQGPQWRGTRPSLPGRRAGIGARLRRLPARLAGARARRQRRAGPRSPGARLRRVAAPPDPGSAPDAGARRPEPAPCRAGLPLPAPPAVTGQAGTAQTALRRAQSDTADTVACLITRTQARLRCPARQKRRRSRPRRSAGISRVLALSGAQSLLQNLSRARIITRQPPHDFSCRPR